MYFMQQQFSYIIFSCFSRNCYKSLTDNEALLRNGKIVSKEQLHFKLGKFVDLTRK